MTAQQCPHLYEMLTPSIDYKGKLYCRDCEKRFELVEWLPNVTPVSIRELTPEEEAARWGAGKCACEHPIDNFYRMADGTARCFRCDPPPPPEGDTYTKAEIDERINALIEFLETRIIYIDRKSAEKAVKELSNLRQRFLP